MNSKPIALFVMIILIFCAQVVFAQQKIQADVKMTGYDIVKVNLDIPFEQKINGRTTTFSESYMVRIFGQFPRNRAIAMALYIGDEPVTEYGSMPGSIYFFLYGKENIQALSGKPFLFKIIQKNEKEPAPLGFKFEPGKFDLKTSMTEKEAFDKK